MVSTSTQVRSGACHCGAVRFKVSLPAELRGARCDCSICAIKGVVMVGAPLEALEIVEGEDVLSCYQFNTRIAKHWFCSRCGIHCYHQRRSDPSQYGINAACLEGISPYCDFPDLPVFDGINHAKDNAGRVRIIGRLKFEPTPPD
jgi:hypothetical protein